ncbi:MAG: hypothetical protein IPF99_11370 [Deltaproteobacteria bacterium]|nr:hypothetical protein [Deltaproteobacteria bacterium]
MRETGHAITERQEAEGWGARVIDQLGDEIQRAFPGVGGFSRPNIYRMRAFYLAYPAAESASAIVSQAVRHPRSRSRPRCRTFPGATSSPSSASRTPA